jgi:hypothetical protein
MFGTEFLAITAAFGVVVSSGITLVIFFPRSIENEILAHESGIRSRGLFSSRHQLSFVSQEQEIFGTYDLEDSPIDCKDISPHCKDTSPPPFSRTTPVVQPRTLYLSPGPPDSQQSLQEPPQYAHQPPPAEPVRLVPNRRAPSPMRIRINETGPKPKPPVDVHRFNNPAMQTSKLRPSFRTPTELRGRPWR